MTLIEKARAGRLAALASLDAANDHAHNVVSIFDFEPVKKAQPIPAFSSIRSQGSVVRLAA
ncbi:MULTISPECIES: hypothetical protein [Maritimibacter]|jgi:hypothetical protein|uniref:Uncharacterized protein n=1 Tax=Maritimibacter alkaliphilus HTCC2654 TaxID=314271 RepID=A3VBN5_9RHOB|nr:MULTISPECIES: hypothetical protein [Maritimibacter]EAQ14368.1 hypothetical protein RB2654_16901 [Rhodobacterales bacterium HTCC2654] [Maritimibacter alkaliphilus HTCC2654]MBL6427258.1 hypothetical protein [Maritimibacter sp.]TYP82541.1 hypothetical protein BD830_104423 [Maritimibacter alkaliphilus HTCC2654]